MRQSERPPRARHERIRPVFCLYRQREGKQPPGAVAEESFLLKCTRCADCITACPHDAIVIAPPRMRAAAGTPTIVTAQSPCRMCSDTPCITACDTGALVAENGMQMGSALIVQQSCLAYQKNFCSVCSEQCPVPGAIRLVEGKPLIDDQVCTGCGVCEFVCPAQQNAILIRPKRIG